MRSIRLFNIFGITIKLHTSFLILLFFFGFVYGKEYGLETGMRAVVLISLVFVSVTFHELCHSLQARRYGVKVRDIVLYPIGGVASMQSIPDNPKQEFMISIAGPMFNIVLAAVLFYPLYYILGPENLFHPSLHSWPRMFANVFWINPILAAFNLLPAFPMDGGRILRAFLAQRMDYQQATRIAVAFGHFFAFLFGFVGLAMHHIFLIIIAVFIYMAASSEETQVDIRYTLKKFYVRDVLPADFLTVPPDAPLSKVLELIFRYHQEDFPVVEGDNLVGFLTRQDIMSSVHQFGLNYRVSNVMRRDFVVLRPEDHLIGAHRKMEEAGLKALPVVRNDRVVGIITLEDISRVYSVMQSKK